MGLLSFFGVSRKAFMNNPIHSITREFHLDHLTRLMPFFTLIYIFQCFLLKSILSNVETGNLLFVTGISLAVMIASIYTYDVQHKVDIFEDYIVVRFPLLHNFKVFYIKDIVEIHMADEDLLQSATHEQKMSLPMSTISVHFNNGEKLNMYFVDSPFYLKTLLEKQRQKVVDVIKTAA